MLQKYEIFYKKTLITFEIWKIIKIYIQTPLLLELNFLHKS